MCNFVRVTALLRRSERSYSPSETPYKRHQFLGRKSPCYADMYLLAAFTVRILGYMLPHVSPDPKCWNWSLQYYGSAEAQPEGLHALLSPAHKPRRCCMTCDAEDGQYAVLV